MSRGAMLSESRRHNLTEGKEKVPPSGLTNVSFPKRGETGRILSLDVEGSMLQRAGA